MADLISRAALLKECAEHQKTDPRFEGRGWASHFINDAGEPSTEWYCVEDMIENAPAVDAVPVVHGRWAPSGDFNGYVCCSACHGVYIDPDWIVDGKWSYCPNCGAMMDGERRESK